MENLGQGDPGPQGPPGSTPTETCSFNIDIGGTHFWIMWFCTE